MAQLLKKTGLIACLAALPAQALASVTLNGVYRGDIGQLEIETASDGRVIGTYSGSGPCDFEPKRPILDGELEGKVLVGTITLCQKGPNCSERPYSILAFYIPEDGSLVAEVKLESGCSSPALQRSRFLLRPVRPEDVRQPSPVAPASARKIKREECRKVAVDQGQQLLAGHDYAGASYYFERALACDAQYWPAHLGLGVAELRRGRAQRATVSLERARDLAHANQQDFPDIFYDLACANARQGDHKSALKNLTTALEMGRLDPQALGTDPDLQSLREEPGFKDLQDRAWTEKERQQKEKSNKGESP